MSVLAMVVMIHIQEEKCKLNVCTSTSIEKINLKFETWNTLYSRLVYWMTRFGFQTASSIMKNKNERAGK